MWSEQAGGKRTTAGGSKLLFEELNQKSTGQLHDSKKQRNKGVKGVKTLKWRFHVLTAYSSLKSMFIVLAVFDLLYICGFNFFFSVPAKDQML